jgi:hypothetical protein
LLRGLLLDNLLLRGLQLSFALGGLLRASS